MNHERRWFEITLISPQLGTIPKNKEIFTKHVAKKVAEITLTEEVNSIEDIEQQGFTGFFRDEDGIWMSAHMIRGFLKNACKVLQETGDIKKIPAYKTWFDNIVHVYPKKIRWDTATTDGVLERSLLGMTPQGPRISLQKSEFVKEGRKAAFEIVLGNNKKGISWDVIEKCLGFGEFVGLGQWRGSGGMGQFVWKEINYDNIEDAIQKVG